MPFVSIGKCHVSIDIRYVSNTDTHFEVFDMQCDTHFEVAVLHRLTFRAMSQNATGEISLSTPVKT